MSNPRITQLGALSATGQGVPRVGVQGDHTFTATVSGSGSVSATVAIMGSNDLQGWVTLVTLTLSGTALATASSAVAASHAYWRADVGALAAGATVQVQAASEEAGGGGSGLSARELAAVQGAVAGSGSVAITHDGSGRVASVVKTGGRSYTYAYPAGSIVITAADGATATATIDGSNRVTGLTGNF